MTAIQLPSNYKTARVAAFKALLVAFVVLLTAKSFSAANLGADVLFVMWIALDMAPLYTLMSALQSYITSELTR